LKQQWTVVDKNIENDMDYLKKQSKGELDIIHRSLDDSIWVVLYYQDKGSPQYYYYDRSQQKSYFLFAGKSKLDSLPLTAMQPVIIPARDGLQLVSYLSLPNYVRANNLSNNNSDNQSNSGSQNTHTENENKKDTKFDPFTKNPVPLVLLVHGGPNSRDRWGYSSLHQWLSNRGYAVLSVNFRGSTGFGKKYANAGNGEWGGKMHTDLLDAVNWAIKQGITKRDTIAIMGRSYGGYATLVAMTKTPDVFVCGVDSVGISNLETFINSIPSYWKPYAVRMKTMIGGDPDTEQGRAFLASRSPIHFVKNISKPLLIEQGGNDPRVKPLESEQIVTAMKENHIPVTYVLFPDEGHVFKHPANKIATIAIEEAFLAQHLGGRFESIQKDFDGSSLQIKEGKEYLSLF
jgi:dipeptidyl aminopeptidase/acylaminoacyl peptidase